MRLGSVFSLAFILFCVDLDASVFSSKAKGTTSAQFLKLAIGARPIGLGEAYTALADDSLSLYWNPAGLNNMSPTRSVSFTHALYVESINYGFLSYAGSLPRDWGNFGVALNYLNIGSIDQTDDAGVSLGAYSPQDTAFIIGWGRKIFSIPLGLSLKYISSKIVNSASTFALDAGVHLPWKFYQDKLSFAASAKNIGPGLKFHTETDPLPFEARFGALLKLKSNFLISSDLALPIDNEPVVAIGSEYRIPLKSFDLALRAGFNSRTLGELSGFTGVSFGFGAYVSGLSLDYALAPLGKLGLTHRVSVGYGF